MLRIPITILIAVTLPTAYLDHRLLVRSLPLNPDAASAEQEHADPLDYLAAINRLVHEPARLAILTALSACEKADFVFLPNPEPDV
ncbi:MAG: hypothetical protein ACRD15_00410 [Vicinamibacterales bacterium]